MTDEPINRIAVTNLMIRTYNALRGVDASDPYAPLRKRELERVSDSIAAIEEFAQERGIALEEKTIVTQGAAPELAAFTCLLCKDSGTIARSTRLVGGYRGPGPVPDYASGVYEAFCDCDFGRELAHEEMHHYRQQASKISAHNSTAKEAENRKRLSNILLEKP